MAQFGIFAWFSYPLPIKERLQRIKQAGFSATSLWWGDEDGAEKHRQPELARHIGLAVDNVHAPYGNTPAWHSNFRGAYHAPFHPARGHPDWHGSRQAAGGVCGAETG